MVDDEVDFLASTSAALARRGFEVATAPDGEQAQRLLIRNDYDVALLDVKMPGIDGVELFNWIKQQKPGLPVILLTGHGSINQAFETSRGGVSDYITKPCDIEIIAEKLRGVVQKNTPLRFSTSSAAMVVETLFIDDEKPLLDTLKSVLERRGMSVTTATSGEEGLKILEAKLFDVVVLDVKMPGLDGIEVLRRLKKSHPLVEVILLTGHPSVSAAMEGVKLGANDYIVKPPDIEELSQKIHQAAEKRWGAISAHQRKIVDEILDRQPD